MRRNSLHHHNPSRRKQTLSQRQPMSSRTLSMGNVPVRIRGSDPSQEVRCLMLNKEQLTVYLPLYLPHRMAVKAVDDALTTHYYQLNKHSPFPFCRKNSDSSSSALQPCTISSHEQEQASISTACGR